MQPPTGHVPAHTSRMLHDHALSHELGFLTDVAILTANQEEEDCCLSLTSGMLVPAFPALRF